MANFDRYIRVPILTNADGSPLAVSTAAYTANDVVGALLKATYGTGKGALFRGITIQDVHKQNEPYIIHAYLPTVSQAIANADAFAPTAETGRLELFQLDVVNGDYRTANGSLYSIAHVHEKSFELPDVCQGVVKFYFECTSTPDYNLATDLYAWALFWVN